MKTNKNLVKLNIAERMVPEFHAGTSIYGEHYVRYDAAQSLVKGKTVLDIACGSGYGTKLLAKNAKKVYGVDIAPEVVEYAQENYGVPNAEYLVGDGESIPLEDNTVDVVISFETIEHIKHYTQFLEEVRRVLKDEGLLVLSTPNELEFAEGNHYHLHEFKEQELKDLLGKQYKYTNSYYQGDWIYSALLPESLVSKETGGIQIKTFNLAPLRPEKYLYFYMLCSNRKISEKLESVGAMSQHWSERTIQGKEAERKRASELTANHVYNLETTNHEQAESIVELSKSLDSINRFKIVRLARKLAQVKSSLAKNFYK
jgi:ubiquinone/menaquinone biosynthesis C-methylase UbiE